jgi:phage-related protein
MPVIRICQFMKLRMDIQDENNPHRVHRYQNYFMQDPAVTFRGQRFDFCPFRVEGSTASLGGENQSLQILMPNIKGAVILVEFGKGNRKSLLELTTAWLNAAGDVTSDLTEYFVGSGATFNDDTIELRFRSAMDSVGSTFPARTLTSENVGILPLTSDLYLR